MTALRLKRHGRLALGRALPVSVALAFAAAVSAQLPRQQTAPAGR